MIKWDNVHDAVMIMPIPYEFPINVIIISSISIAVRLRAHIQSQMSGFKSYIYYLQDEYLLQIAWALCASDNENTYNTYFEELLWRFNEIFLRAWNSAWYVVSTHCFRNYYHHPPHAYR